MIKIYNLTLTSVTLATNWNQITIPPRGFKRVTPTFFDRCSLASNYNMLVDNQTIYLYDNE